MVGAEYSKKNYRNISLTTLAAPLHSACSQQQVFSRRSFEMDVP